MLLNAELREFFKKLDERSNDMKAMVVDIAKQLPQFSFPELEIDYERVERITKDHSRYGWTLTGEIGLSVYLNDDLVDVSLKDKDDYFLNYYSDNEWKHYKETKKAIMETIDPKWEEVMEECFEGFERDKYKSIIPTLISIIEGETAFIYQTDLIGNRMVSYMNSQSRNEEDKFTKIAIYSLIYCMKKQLFLIHDFNKKRKPVINRNWVLHGRDDPKLWEKVDALRLLNILSSVQLVKVWRSEETE